MKSLKKILAALTCAVLVIGTVAALASSKPIVAEAAGETVNVVNAVISGNKVLVQTASASIPSSDDGVFRLLSQKVNETGAQGTVVAFMPAASNVDFVFDLKLNTADSNLFNHFTVAVMRGGVLTPVSDTRYITNPEAVSGKSAARMVVGKKGILPAASYFGTAASGIKPLGIQQVVYNLPMNDLFLPGASIAYSYNGKTYNFNRSIVNQYDYLVPMLNRQGVQVTIILLNNLTSDVTLIHPLARGAACPYYSINVVDTAAVERLQALASFLGERYSGTKGLGQVDNWILGNEVNARGSWHYLNTTDVNYFVQEYAKAFRIFYNGIKSKNSNANVYINIDSEWTTASNVVHFTGKAFLDSFNSQMAASGNVNWSLSHHPHNAPLFVPASWANPSRYVQNSVNTPYISVQNLSVLTDYMSQPAFLSPSGEVRSIILSEVGYTSSGGEAVQAASIAYAYMQAEVNQHIDGIMICRELEDAYEVSQGLAFGLRHVDGTPKVSYTWYAQLGPPGQQAVLDAASSVMGQSIFNLLTPR